MRAQSAFTAVADPYRAGLRLGEQLAELEPEVVFLFCSIHLGESPELLGGLYDGLGSDRPIVIGNSGDGMFSDAGPADIGASALALNSDGTMRWKLISQPRVAAEPARSTEAALAAAQDWLQGRKAALMTMFCDFNTDASEIERVLGGMSTPMIGGLAGDDNQMRSCAVFANHETLRDHLVLLVAEGPLKFSIHIGNSIAAIGQPGLIEEADGKVVSRISGLPAQDFIEKQAGKEVMESDRGITSLTIIDHDEPGIKRLRSIVPQFTDMTGALGLYGGIEVGKRVQVCMARPEDLIREIYEIADREKDRQPVAALAVSCAGRKWLLGEQLHHEVDALNQTFRGIPLAGFPSFGEIGPLRLPDGRYSRNLFHNMTFVLLLIES